MCTDKRGSTGALAYCQPPLYPDCQEVSFHLTGTAGQWGITLELLRFPSVEQTGSLPCAFHNDE